MMKYPVIVFDFDGTLVDSFDPALEYLFEVLLPKYRVKNLEKKNLESLRQMSFGELMTFIPWGFIKIWPLIWEVKKWHDKNLHLVSLYPEIPDMVRTLAEAGFTMMILTSNSKDNVQQVLRRYNVERYFEDIWESHGLFNKPKTLRKVMHHYGLKAKEMIYVGDEIRDVKACKKVGVPIIAVTYGFNAREGLAKYDPEYLVSSPRRLPMVVEMVSHV